MEVAGILADMKMDPASISTGLLHDTVEDTLTTLEEIKTAFGEEVAFLVDGLTKLSKITFGSQEERQAENFRKMILAMSSDIRIIIVKLVDRIHNMKTLEFQSPDKQKYISRETLDIYAPLANRLGINWMKIEFEDLAFKFLNPAIYQDLSRRIALKKDLLDMPAWDPRRKVYKARAAAHKWLLVTCFGYLGYKNARFGRIEAHESVTAYGREALLRAKEVAEEMGYEVLHMYVDGLWVCRPGGSSQPASSFQPRGLWSEAQRTGESTRATTTDSSIEAMTVIENWR